MQTTGHPEEQPLTAQELDRARRDLKAYLVNPSQFEDEAEQYSKELCFYVCRQLTTKIRAQEVRDQIYEYLFRPTTIPLIAYDPSLTRTLSQATQACPFSPAFSSYTFDLKWTPPADSPFMWQCNEVGHEVLIELVQTWYRVNTFLITDCSLIADFVLSDRWQLGVVPRAHLSHVRLSFAEWQITGKWEVLPPRRVQQLRTDLERLRHFRETTKITIDIISRGHARNHCDRFCTPPYQVYDCSALCNGIWEQDACEIAEFVEKLDAAVFGILRKLLNTGHSLEFIVDDHLVIIPSKAEDIEYGALVSKILNFSAG